MKPTAALQAAEKNLLSTVFLPPSALIEAEQELAELTRMNGSRCTRYYRAYQDYRASGYILFLEQYVLDCPPALSEKAFKLLFDFRKMLLD
ncbi:MAG: hypothetical protein EOO46_01265 [Flavobacterium sp.]|nr:MAG: hypothetical protein EOO46_01265 [Flavobacterium sp.]